MRRHRDWKRTCSMLTRKFRWGAVALPAALILGSCAKSHPAQVTNTNIPAKCPASAFRQFVVNSVALPTSTTTFAVDLNGDSTADNQYQAIVTALAQQNLDSQAAMDQGIASGAAIALIQQASADLAFQQDPCATATVRAGDPVSPPDFSGNGTFTAAPGPA